jgi:putative CocE/NonD family hydrolase
MMFGWFRDWVPKVSFGPPEGIDREAWYQSPWADAYETQPVRQAVVDVERHLRTLPVQTLLDRAGAAPSDFGEQMRRSADPSDPWFRDQGFLTEEDHFHTPNIFITGPLERGGGSFDNFRLFQSNAVTEDARRHQYLWFTPAAHSGYAECDEDTRFGARALGDTRFPYYAHLLAWFAHWLRDDPLRLESWPSVRYFLAGANRWCEAGAWPPNGETGVLHLGAGGTLRPGAPGGHGVDSYIYDPGDPTPSEPPGTPVDLLGGGYADRTEIERRPDVVTYTSEPMIAPLAIVGPVTLILHVASSAPDTDFVAVLSEVDGEGRSINVTHGVTRMRFRDGFERQSMMREGEIYRIVIDLWHASIEIPVGHRLRLAISSSHFPAFDRNLNTGGDNFTDTEWRSARNEIHYGGDHASALILPAIAGNP